MMGRARSSPYISVKRVNSRLQLVTKNSSGSVSCLFTTAWKLAETAETALARFLLHSVWHTGTPEHCVMNIASPRRLLGPVPRLKDTRLQKKGIPIPSLSLRIQPPLSYFPSPFQNLVLKARLPLRMLSIISESFLPTSLRRIILLTPSTEVFESSCSVSPIKIGPTVKLWRRCWALG